MKATINILENKAGKFFGVIDIEDKFFEGGNISIACKEFSSKKVCITKTEAFCASNLTGDYKTIENNFKPKQKGDKKSGKKS